MPASPTTVPTVHGTENEATPPKTYPGTAEATSAENPFKHVLVKLSETLPAARTFCQKPVSMMTPPKLDLYKLAIYPKWRMKRHPGNSNHSILT
jgi:hypothetical protein